MQNEEGLKAMNQHQRLDKSPAWLTTLLAATLLYAAPPAGAAEWTCTRGDGSACTGQELGDPGTFKQILVVPTGYEPTEKAQFFADAESLRLNMSDLPGDTLYSEVYRDRLLYLAYWVPGGPLSSDTAAFGGAIIEHPIRDRALTMDQDALYSKVSEIQGAEIPQLAPWAVLTLFNSPDTGATANATPPSYTRRSYGIARITAGFLASNYVPTHEVAHASLSFVDEYVEGGFEDVDIRLFDILTPLALYSGKMASLQAAVGDLLGVYDINVSEILVSGADNMALRQYPATVDSGLPTETYECEGGFFFGKGTFHVAGDNIMNGNRVQSCAEDGFGYTHSLSQARVVDTAFGDGTAGRANDRLRIAGPVGDWALDFGETTTVLIYDGDKNHRWQPTKSYDVQVGWYETVLDICYESGIPYPCLKEVWKSFQKSVSPTEQVLELKTSKLYGIARTVQNLVCNLGLGDLGEIDLCTLTVDQMADAFLPTLKFYMPYQPVEMALSGSFRTYYWRFRTFNGTYRSGWTGWSSFYRAF